MIAAYWSRLDSADETTRIEAAQAWLGWEDNAATLQHDVDAQSTDDPLDTLDTLAKARIEAHYFRNGIFLEPDQLLRDINRIRHLPCVIVQGRYDIICPPRSAWDLAKAWPEARLATARTSRPRWMRWCGRRMPLPTVSEQMVVPAAGRHPTVRG